MGNDIGWIKLTRTLMQSPLWEKSGKYDPRSAFIELCLAANYKPGVFTLKTNGDVIDVQPGQLITSYQKLADKWHWDRKTVIRFLRFLQKLDLIKLQVFQRCGTSITIVNYDGSAIRRTQGGTQGGTQEGTQEGTYLGTQRGTQRGTQYKNSKKGKNSTEIKKSKNSAQRFEDIWGGDPE